MPFQVSGQFVTTKSSRLPHVAGAFVVTAGAAFVTMMSSADASVAYAAPASPKIIAAKTANFFILPPPEYDRSRSWAGPTQRLVHRNLDSVFTTRSDQGYTATILLGKSLSAASQT